MLSACSNLIQDVTSLLTATTEKIKLNLESMLDMKDYVHYQANLDIQKDCTKMKLVDTACTDQSDEPYLVEK